MSAGEARRWRLSAAACRRSGAYSRVGYHRAAGSRFAGTDGVTIERRRHERRAVRIVAWISEMDKTGTPQAPWRAVTTDISRSGIGLRTRRIVVPGRRVLMSLRIPGGQPKFLHGEVRHASYESAGRYRVGVEFEAMPGTDEVRYWVAARGLENAEG